MNEQCRRMADSMSNSSYRTDATMHATVEIAPAIDASTCGRDTQRDHIVSLLKAGDEEVSLHRLPEATLAYYSIFQPALCEEPNPGLLRVAPVELYEEAASKLRRVATQYAEELIACRCFLAGECPGGAVGVPRGALNLYLISNQSESFTERAVQYAAEEMPTRNISRFLRSAVRARLEHLRNVRSCATLLNEEQEALEKLGDFEARLRTCLTLRRQASYR